MLMVAIPLHLLHLAVLISHLPARLTPAVLSVFAEPDIPIHSDRLAVKSLLVLSYSVLLSQSTAIFASSLV